MSNLSSPSRHSADLDSFYDTNFTADISQKMRVPKHISAAGEAADEARGHNHWISPMDLQEKFEMHVPDRILVIGQEQHVGTRAPPRELQLENAVMPPDPGFIRVQTPPRIISLDQHFFPSADDTPVKNDYNYPVNRKTRNGPMNSISDDLGRSALAMREVTPPNEGMSTAEEVLHLRRQVVKLSRRVMAVELEVTQQQQREKVLLALGVAYFLIKTVMWITKSPTS